MYALAVRKASIGADDEKTRRRLYAVVNRLSLHLVAKTFETDLACVAFHQLRVMQRLAIRDVAAVLIFFLDLAADVYVRRVFGELKNIRTEKANTAFDGRLQRADGSHH